MSKENSEQIGSENDDIFAKIFESLVAIGIQMRQERKDMEAGIVSGSMRFKKISVEPLDN